MVSGGLVVVCGADGGGGVNYGCTGTAEWGGGSEREEFCRDGLVETEFFELASFLRVITFSTFSQKCAKEKLRIYFI